VKWIKSVKKLPPPPPPAPPPQPEPPKVGMEDLKPMVEALVLANTNPVMTPYDLAQFFKNAVNVAEYDTQLRNQVSALVAIGMKDLLP